jgi:queuine tRNA-ribosyltransferase
MTVVSFREVARDGDARAGVLTTPHGEVLTPTFMPVGTQGAVKTLLPEEVAATGARIVLGNTYHLWQRPGPDVVAELGGLHRFSGWPHAMLTDSGGFQAFSLAKQCKQTDDGFVFRSHYDGNRCHLSPEEAVRIQRLIGADIAMQLDVCPSGKAPQRELERACRVTSAWAERCLAAKRRDDERGADPQALFGIVQGGTDVALRRSHHDEMAALPVEGLALGGFSVGEPNARMHEVLEEVAPHMDAARPRYLMGVGKPADLVKAIGAGIDMFDCVLPTRNARTGQALTRRGRVVLKHARHRRDPRPLDDGCGCPTCRIGFSRGYLRHLRIVAEPLVLRLVSQHNLQLYADLTREARQAIVDGRYASFRQRFLAELEEGDIPPLTQG